MTVPLIDVARWPLVYIVYGTTGNVKELNTYIRQLRTVYERGVHEVFATVNDCRDVDYPNLPAEVRQAFVDGINKLAVEYPRTKKVGEAIVLQSVAGRAAFAAANMRRKRNFPIAFFGTIGDAESWCNTLLATATLCANDDETLDPLEINVEGEGRITCELDHIIL